MYMYIVHALYMYINSFTSHVGLNNYAFVHVLGTCTCILYVYMLLYKI